MPRPNPMPQSPPPDFGISEKHPGEDGGMYVVVFAVCAISGGIVGFLIGLLVG